MLRRTLLATAALGLGLAMTGTSAMAAGMDHVKACFVYIGPIGDGGWTFQHHDGAMQVQAAFGDKVELRFTVTVHTGEDVHFPLRQ